MDLNKEDGMSNRRRLARERLEIYLVHMILAHRRLLWLVGLLLLVYAIATMFVNPLAGCQLYCLPS
jgi:hypothetical protein